MLNKNELVQALIPAFKKKNPGMTHQQILDDLYQRGTSDLRQIYARTVGSELTDLEEETIRATAELAAEREIRRLRAAETKRQQKVEARQVFSHIAMQLGLNDGQANFELAYALLGSDLSEQSVQQSVRDGRLDLAPATVEEISRRTVEAIERHQDWMKNHATQTELREQVAIQSEYARERAQRAYLDQQLALRTEREAWMGFPPLPPSVTKEQIYKMSGEEMRRLVKRHGFAMVDRRLQGKG